MSSDRSKHGLLRLYLCSSVFICGAVDFLSSRLPAASPNPVPYPHLLHEQPATNPASPCSVQCYTTRAAFTPCAASTNGSGFCGIGLGNMVKELHMGIEFQELYVWMRRRKIFATLLVIFTLCLGIMIGTMVSGHAQATHDQSATGATLLSLPDPVILSNSFSAISKKIGPAVVNISTTQIMEKPKGGKKPNKGLGDPLEDFFDRFLQAPDQGPDAERSLGSGVIVDKKGFILTNDHVIDQATKIQVTLDGDSTKYNGHVVGFDKDTDLAVVKIDANHDFPSPSSETPTACRSATGCSPSAAPSV